MKKVTLTLMLALIVSAGIAQRKPNKRYFYYTVEFTSSDGCSHSNWGKFTSDEPNISADFDFILRAIKKYVAPFKVDLKTFHITEYKIISKKEWLTYKANKFNPCKADPVNYQSTISYSGCDTCLFISNSRATIWHTAAFVAFGSGTEILHISVPDSTQTYTVKFTKSKVHFINDSTFTFTLK